MAKAIRKYGPEGFALQILAHAPSQELDRMERIWIVLMNSLSPNGYNLTVGGDGGVPCKEVRKRRAATFKTTRARPEIAERFRLGSQRPWKDPVYREMQAELSRQRWKDPDYRARVHAKILHRASDPAWKKKMGEISKQRWTNAEYRDLATKQLKETAKSPAFRKKMSDLAKKRWSNPAFRKKLAQPEHVQIRVNEAKRRWSSPEFREKVDAGMKKTWAQPEKLLARSEMVKHLWEDPEYRKAHCAALKNGWIGRRLRAEGSTKTS
jgi:hypothetical protein